MRRLGHFDFPDFGNPDEVAGWKPAISWRPLSQRVLCAAITRIEGKWAAYCRDVAGCDHREEAFGVLRNGEKLGETVARAVFPEFDGIPYAS